MSARPTRAIRSPSETTELKNGTGNTSPRKEKRVPSEATLAPSTLGMPNTLRSPTERRADSETGVAPLITSTKRFKIMPIITIVMPVSCRFRRAKTTNATRLTNAHKNGKMGFKIIWTKIVASARVSSRGERSSVPTTPLHRPPRAHPMREPTTMAKRVSSTGQRLVNLAR